VEKVLRKSRTCSYTGLNASSSMTPFGKTQNGLFVWSGLSFMLVKSNGIGSPDASIGRGMCMVDCVGGVAALRTCEANGVERAK